MEDQTTKGDSTKHNLSLINSINSSTLGDWTDDLNESNSTDLTVYTSSFVCKSNKDKKEEKRPVDNCVTVNLDRTELDTMTDIEILEKTTLIAKNLKFQLVKKYEDNNETCVKWLLEYLDILKDGMTELSIRNSQNHINTKNESKKKGIMRNSYKFCEYGCLCKFNYEQGYRCYSQHYVYGLVCQDILGITDYIKNNVIDVNEIKTSINTITYVINHMFEELSYLKSNYPQKYSKYECRQLNDTCPNKSHFVKKSKK